MKKYWISLFSQTGSEIVALSKAIGRSPDFILSNNVDESKYQLHPELTNLAVIGRSDHNTIMQLLRKSADPNNTKPTFSPNDCIFTLHGYLRIIPEDICNAFEMYNGHPGAVDLYPELKGKDPQEKVWQSNKNYPIIGSIVHRVTPGVDEGEICCSVHIDNDCETLDDVYSSLKETSLEAWKGFMNERGLG